MSNRVPPVLPLCLASISTSLVFHAGVHGGGGAPCLWSIVLWAQGQGVEVSSFLMLQAVIADHRTLAYPKVYLWARCLSVNNSAPCSSNL